MKEKLKFIQVVMGIGLFCLSISGKGQSYNFSQYHFTPLSSNPGLVATENEAAALLIHKDQSYGKGITLKQSMLTLRYPFLHKTSGKRWGGIGLAVYQHTTNSTDFLRQQGIIATLGYNLPLTQRSYLSFGMQGNYHQYHTSLAKVSTGSQWIANRGYDPTASLNENFSGERAGYVSFSSGVWWYHTNQKGYPTRYLGVSVFNLNQPEAAFTAYQETLPLHYGVQGGYELYNSGIVSLTPEARYIHQFGHHTLQVGQVTAFHFQDHNPFNAIQSGSVALATRYVSDHVMALSVQFRQPHFTVGFNYDMVLADASAFHQAIEFGIALRKSLSKPPAASKKKVTAHDYTIGQVRAFSHQQNPVPAPIASPPNTNKTDTLQTLPIGDFALTLKHDVKFAFNDTTLHRKAKAYLEELFSLLKDNPDLKLRVVGHTDRTGPEEVNQEVSEKRAEKVVAYLVAKGIAENRLQAVGQGSASPLLDHDTPAHRAANRRVEFVIYRE